MDLIVTDGHEGLLAAASALFTATPRQRCVVHKQRNGPRTEIYVKIGYRENEQKPALLVIGLVLCSLNAVTKESPPAFLHIEPARSFRNEDLVNTWMLGQPGIRLYTQMAGQIIGNHKDVSCRVVGFDVGKERNIALGVARGRAAGQLLAIAHTQRSIDPSLFRPSTILQRRLDSVSRSLPSWSRGKSTRQNWSQFISTDGRRSRWRSRVVGDDRYSFGAKSLSVLVPQLWVRRQRTPSRKQIRRI